MASPEDLRRIKLYYSVRKGPTSLDRTYHTVVEVLSHDKLCKQVIADFWLEAKRFYTRFQAIKDYAEIAGFMCFVEGELKKRGVL